MGVTGVRQQISTQARELVRRTRDAGGERVCVGLGVATGAQAAEIAGYADGVIVGSALVRALGGAEVGGREGVAAGSGQALEDLTSLAAELAVGAHARPRSAAR